MRRQWPCSKCGFACSSTWRSVNSNSSKTVVCNSCKSKSNKLSKFVTNPIPPTKQEISHNNYMPENVGLTINQIGMGFGNLTFQPNTALPKLKSKVFVLGGSMGHQDNLYYGTTIKSLLGQEEIHIKEEECDYKETSPEAATKSPLIWDPKKVQKKRRSKLPQYTLSPLQRLLNQFQNITRCESSYDKQKHPKMYDDVLIYEKCKFIGDNEIGLGAMLLPQSDSSKMNLFKLVECSTSSTIGLFDKPNDVASSCSIKEIKQEPCTSDSSDAYSSLVDGTIRSPFK